ncbi:MAG: energy transducer TonB [Nitrospira sp.]|nr:energy transducer TonB [Nitrospira sp.]
MSIKRFFAYSIVVHTLIIISVLSLRPAAQWNKGGEFFTRLISPDELSSPQQTRRSSRKPLPFVPDLKEERSSPHVQPEIKEPLQDENVSAMPEKGGQYTEELREGKGKSKDRIEIHETPGTSIREKLFDKSIIRDLAQREIEKENKTKRENVFTFDTNEYRFLTYNKRLKEKIESIWMYPIDAAENGIYGDLIVRFTIKKNGSLGSVELVRTSGYKSLDDAALKALNNAEPFWPLPDEWGMEAYTVVGHFIYTIYGYYVR